MTTKRAIEVALREIDAQLACDDIDRETRSQLQKASRKLKQFIRIVYGERQ